MTGAETADAVPVTASARREAAILLIGGPGSTLGARLLETLPEAYRVATTWFEHAPECPIRADRVTLLQADVRDAAAVEALVATADRDLGGVDVLINNAGAFRGGLLPATTSESWRRVLDVNLTGVFNACRSVSRRMMRRRKGKIINVASAKGLAGGEGESAYAASKAGVIALTRSLARELAPYDIAVNAVCPGFMSSRLNGFDERLRAREAEAALMDIRWNVEDTASFITFLCGDSLKSVTGQVFHVDSRIDWV